MHVPKLRQVWKVSCNSRSKKWQSNSSGGDNRPATPSIFRWYAAKLDSHPLTTKGITSGIIASGGDLLSQCLFSKEPLDAIRTGRFAILGTFLVAPVVHFWYARLATSLPGSQVKTVVMRVLCDQLLFAPIFLPVWLGSMRTLEGDTNALPKRLLDEVPAIVVANWAIWVPAQALNFYMVPVKFQVLFSNVVGFVWTTYLSYATNQET